MESWSLNTSKWTVSLPSNKDFCFNSFVGGWRDGRAGCDGAAHSLMAPFSSEKDEHWRGEALREKLRHREDRLKVALLKEKQGSDAWPAESGRVLSRSRRNRFVGHMLEAQRGRHRS